jgi:beta-lactamase superfamily II metal-dependent hydrolase
VDYEIDFIPVGDSHGDAICVRYLDPLEGYVINVIDGGYAEIGDAVVRHIRRHWGTNHIDNLILTHADADHAAGLITIMEQCEVGTLRMNRPWLYGPEVMHRYRMNLTPEGYIRIFKEKHEYLVRLEEMAKGKTDMGPIFAGNPLGPFTVLAPTYDRYLSLIPGLRGPVAVDQPYNSYAPARGQNKPEGSYESWEYETLQEYPEPPTTNSNETSVVLHAQFGTYRALFTGDVGPIGLMEAANVADALGIARAPNMFQIPHQGSRHNVTPTALDRWLGQQIPQGSPTRGTATCSVGGNKTDYPRKTVTNALMRRGYTTYVARDKVLSYSTHRRSGWTSVASEPFHTIVEDAA